MSPAAAEFASACSAVGLLGAGAGDVLVVAGAGALVVGAVLRVELPHPATAAVRIRAVETIAIRVTSRSRRKGPLPRDHGRDRHAQVCDATRQVHVEPARDAARQ